MTWHKKSGASVTTPHVKTPHVSVPKPHKAPVAKAKATNQKTAIYTAKPVQKVAHHSVKKVKGA